MRKKRPSPTVDMDVTDEELEYLEELIEEYLKETEEKKEEVPESDLERFLGEGNGDYWYEVYWSGGE